MVTHLHSHCLCSLRKFGYNDAVELRGGGIPADMVMYCDNVSCIVEHPESHDILRVGSVFRHLSPADSDSSEQFMFRIKEHEY